MKRQYFTKEDFYEIAKVIDNEFNGSEKTFTADRKVGYNYLTTNKCDFASFIRVWNDGYTITSIERMGEDTDGFQLIHPETVKNVNKIISQLKKITHDPHL